MQIEVSAEFSEPSTVAAYIGEAVGTHYSAALRATEAFGKHLAGDQKELTSRTFRGKGLESFWADMMKSEQVEVTSPSILKELGSTSSYYLSYFLDTADVVFRKRYEEVSEPLRKKIGQTQHAQCIRILRDYSTEGIVDQFGVRNKVATWMQMIKFLGGYQE